LIASSQPLSGSAHTRACVDGSPELEKLAQELTARGIGAAECIRIAKNVNGPESCAEVAHYKKQLGLAADFDGLERVILRHATLNFGSQIDLLPVPASVKILIQKEFGQFQGPLSAKNSLLTGTDPFVTACKITTLRRFPAGPMDWVVSGLPWSWLKKMQPGQIAPALWYTFQTFGGRRPAFYVHLAHPPRNRSLVIENEVRKAYFRMAQALKLQPHIKGIMTAAWFHDPEALKENPHLAALNEPYLQHGGKLVASLGGAPADSGFLAFNRQRRKEYEEGKHRYHLTLAMWPRQRAIAWADLHPELEK